MSLKRATHTNRKSGTRCPDSHDGNNQHKQTYCQKDCVLEVKTKKAAKPDRQTKAKHQGDDRSDQPVLLCPLQHSAQGLPCLRQLISDSSHLASYRRDHFPLGG
mmetsp:Transcript_30417/g.45880  ORF Transcript_30417/g.45880 Transcript_30417/m.45880 type:complete len:104 (-) Transcript_30417:681-992(-)